MNPTAILVLGAIALAVVIYLTFLKRSSDHQSNPVPRSAPATFTQPPGENLSILDTPDTPQPFGYKMAWFAIKTQDSAKVIAAFGLKAATPSNWASGVKAVYTDIERIFVTPPVDGWTFVVGLGLPSFDTKEQTQDFLAFVKTVATSFPEFYYFGTHRVVDFHGWMRVAHGKIERAYAYLGERGETLFESGTKTNEEIALGFQFFDERSPEAKSKDYFERKDLRFPNEEDVMKISAAWTIDTQALDKQTEKGTGFLARVK